MIHLLCMESVFAWVYARYGIDSQTSWLQEFGMASTVLFIISLLILIIGVATLTYYIVELPAKRYLSRLQRKWKSGRQIHQT